MKRLWFILPLLFVFSCEDNEDNDDSHPFVGLWEIKGENENGNWVDYSGGLYWLEITENTISQSNENFNADSSVCYYHGPEYPMEINKEGDNYRLAVFLSQIPPDTLIVMTCSLQDGMMYYKTNYDDDWIQRLEKINSFDFTPLCE